MNTPAQPAAPIARENELVDWMRSPERAKRHLLATPPAQWPALLHVVQQKLFRFLNLPEVDPQVVRGLLDVHDAIAARLRVKFSELTALHTDRAYQQQQQQQQQQHGGRAA